MGSIVIRSAEIIDTTSDLNGAIRSILIEDGVIKKISEKELSADTVIEGKGLKVSIGWMDMRVTTGDPGHEYKEDLHSVCKAAMQGGFTAIAVLPNTTPPMQTKESVEYVKSKTREKLVEVFPIASLTINNKGEELTEILDMNASGAVGFSDGVKPIWHSDLLLRALLYMQPINAQLIVHAEDKYLSQGGQMNEGKTSTMLGLKGIPKLSEQIIVERDLTILEYTGGKIHFAHISSPKSLELIKDAKRRGLKVTCDIASYQLALDDTLLTSFDSNLKVNPPLRSKRDIDTFWKYINDGTIDAIVSDHIPQDTESKQLEFDQADFGMIGLETMFSVANTYNTKVELAKLIEKITVAPRNILGLEVPAVKEGAKANLTVFETEQEWILSEKDLRSKSVNTPFIGKKLKGRPVAVINNKQVTRVQ
ncbi:MAG: dihydroorotase [Cytophaga sp.]|uniref:dihydroorotase n=1 Tax=Cytophaga sp. TaxID=29535 RepID=UPI003F7D9D5B